MVAKADRFRTTKSTFCCARKYFVFSALLVASVLASGPGAAEGLFDLFGGGGLFGGPPAAPPSPGQPGPARHRHDGHPGGGHQAGLSYSGGRKSVCVRLCDGYVFPVGAYRGDSDRNAQELTCHVGCPGAETALYLMPASSDSVADAMRAGTRANYSKLPAAFKYQKSFDPTCTCHRPNGGVASLLHDYTLRRGDAVMTPGGFKVFHGGRGFPFKQQDFSPLLASRDVAKEKRPILLAMEKTVQKPSFREEPEQHDLTVFRKKPRSKMLVDHQASR